VPQVAERPVLLMPPPEFRQRRTGRLLLLIGLLVVLVALVVGAVAFVLGAASQRTPGEPAPAFSNVAPASVTGGT
jgi:flagellar basal body-associated protein FliL